SGAGSTGSAWAYRAPMTSCCARWAASTRRGKPGKASSGPGSGSTTSASTSFTRCRGRMRTTGGGRWKKWSAGARTIFPATVSSSKTARCSASSCGRAGSTCPATSGSWPCTAWPWIFWPGTATSTTRSRTGRFPGGSPATTAFTGKTGSGWGWAPARTRSGKAAASPTCGCPRTTRASSPKGSRPSSGPKPSAGAPRWKIPSFWACGCGKASTPASSPGGSASVSRTCSARRFGASSNEGWSAGTAGACASPNGDCICPTRPFRNSSASDPLRARKRSCQRLDLLGFYAHRVPYARQPVAGQQLLQPFLQRAHEAGPSVDETGEHLNQAGARFDLCVRVRRGHDAADADDGQPAADATIDGGHRPGGRVKQRRAAESPGQRRLGAPQTRPRHGGVGGHDAAGAPAQADVDHRVQLAGRHVGGHLDQHGLRLAVGRGQPVPFRRNPGQQPVQRPLPLQVPQARRVGGADVDDEVVRQRVQRPQAVQIVAQGLLGGGVPVFPDVHPDVNVRPAPRLPEAFGQRGRAVVVEAHSVDQGPAVRQAPQAGFGMAGLRAGRHGAHFDEAETQRGQGGNGPAVLVQSRGQADAGGKPDAEGFGRQLRRVQDVPPPQGRQQAGEAAGRAQKRHGHVVGPLRVRLPKQRAEKFVHRQRSGGGYWRELPRRRAAPAAFTLPARARRVNPVGDSSRRGRPCASAGRG